MAFILPGVLLIGLVLIAIWWTLFGTALRHEWRVREMRRREADFERLLSAPGEPLYCVSCQKAFRGPLPSEGCPHCHLRSLVVPARYSQDPKTAEAVRELPLPTWMTTENAPLQESLQEPQAPSVSSASIAESAASDDIKTIRSQGT